MQAPASPGAELSAPEYQHRRAIDCKREARAQARLIQTNVGGKRTAHNAVEEDIAGQAADSAEQEMWTSSEKGRRVPQTTSYALTRMRL